MRKIKSRTAARQARRKPRTTRRRPHQHQLASASLTTGAPDGAPANFGLVHVLKAEPLVTESPAIGERTVHHLEAGSNRLKPAQPQHPTPQRDAADPVLARIYLEGKGKRSIEAYRHQDIAVLLSRPSLTPVRSRATRCDIHRLFVRCWAGFRSPWRHNSTTRRCAKSRHTTPRISWITPMRSRAEARWRPAIRSSPKTSFWSPRARTTTVSHGGASNVNHFTQRCGHSA